MRSSFAGRAAGVGLELRVRAMEYEDDVDSAAAQEPIVGQQKMMVNCWTESSLSGRPRSSVQVAQKRRGSGANQLANWK